MPKITKSAQEQSTDSPIDQVISSLAGEITVSTNPVFICGVNRKVNIGNFENVDVYENSELVVLFIESSLSLISLSS